MICKVSKQDGCGVVEKDKMKSVHSPYSTQSIKSVLILFTCTLYQSKTKKIKLPIYLLNPCGYDTC